jgi:hypothetical protein
VKKWLIERELDLGEAFRAKNNARKITQHRADFKFLLGTVWFDKQ